MTSIKPIPKEILNNLEENAIAASRNKELGDSWTRNHGCVTAYHYNPKEKRGEGVLIAMPGEKNALYGYPNDPVNEFAFSRHICGASPKMMIRLIRELKALRGE